MPGIIDAIKRNFIFKSRHYICHIRILYIKSPNYIRIIYEIYIAAPKIWQNSPKIRAKFRAKFPQKWCQNSPPRGAKFRVKITPKKSFLSRPPRTPQNWPPRLRDPQNIYKAQEKGIFGGPKKGPPVPGPKNPPRAPGPPGPGFSPRRPAGRPPAILPPVFIIPL